MAKRFLGTFRRPDGSTQDITEETPVDVLLDVIEDLHAQCERERAGHRRTMDLLTAVPHGR